MSQLSQANLTVGEASRNLENFSRQVAINVESHIFPGKDYFMNATTAELGNIKACLIDAGPHEAFVKARQVTGMNLNAWTLVLQLEGEIMLESEELALKLKQGDWNLHQAPKSFKVWCLQPIKQLILKIPECEIDRLKPFFPRIPEGPFNNKSRLGKILFDFVVNSFEEASVLRKETTSDLAQIILQLLVFTLSESLEPRQNLTSKDILRERVKLIITRRFTDPNFTIDEIAASLNCSKRYLHMAFRDSPEAGSLGHFILNTRLEKCKAELARENNRLPIAQIAFACGFNDASYFSKIFRQYFEMSPSEYRRQFGRSRRVALQS